MEETFLEAAAEARMENEPGYPLQPVQIREGTPIRPKMNATERRRAEQIINGDVVRARRKSLGLSQVELAIMAATTTRVIASIERSKALDPPTSTTLRLAKSLSVTVESLCRGAQPYTSRYAGAPHDPEVGR